MSGQQESHDQELIRLGKIGDEEERNRQFVQRDENMAGRKAIDEYYRKLKQEVGPLSRMRYSDMATFRNQLNDFLGVQLASIARRLCAPAPSAPPQRRSPRPGLPGYPFRSMKSLDYGDYDIFRGRDRKLAELRERLSGERVRFRALPARPALASRRC